jgi:hypothetical protein
VDRREKSAVLFAYADYYLIDVKYGIIMDVEASCAIRQAELGASRTMLKRTEKHGEAVRAKLPISAGRAADKRG